MTPETFWTKVDKSGDCWLWTGSHFASGYGSVATKGHAHLRAHRVSWELTHGPIGAGVEVCHRCDVRDCVNPAHLFLGTHAENMADMSRKGRASPGNQDRAMSIVADLMAGSSQRAAARRHGVATPYVQGIATGRKNRRAWAGYLGRELDYLPRTGGRTPLLVVIETPGPGKKARALVVMDESDWIDLHRGEDRG